MRGGFADCEGAGVSERRGDPAAILKLLLTLVPALPEEIRRGRFFPGIYETVLSVIEEYGSDDQREWADLAQVCRQEMVRLRAGALC